MGNLKCPANQITIGPGTYEPVHVKTNNFGFRPGPTQTGLYSHRRQIEAGNFGFKSRGIVLSVYRKQSRRSASQLILRS